YTPFTNQLEFELSYFVHDIGLSKDNTKRLLQIFDLVPNFLSPFVNRDQIYQKISSTVAPPIPWHKTTISLDKLPCAANVPPSWKKDLDFHFQDIIDVVQVLYGNPTFEHDTVHAPVMELDHNGKQIFSEPFTGTW
ncbi:hypothetical protein BT69DRAFT_1196845, partial [Atractiella rhizophila]